MITKPMLAGPTEDRAKLKFPLIASPKLDGIRCILKAHQAVSRKFLPIPNEHIQDILQTIVGVRAPGLLDGELMLDDPTATFQEVTSAVMSHDGEPEFRYWVFDTVNHPDMLDEPYYARLGRLISWHTRLPASVRRYVKLVPTLQCKDLSQLERFEVKMLADGYEGLCLRSLEGPYKEGRSTFKEGYLLKLKQFVDAEAVIVGFEEAEANTNAATKDETGHTKRSQAKAGKVGKDTLGAFLVQPIERYGKGPAGEFPGLFRIGTGIGLTARLRQEIWDNRKKYTGKIIKYRYQAQGTKDAPRIPSFQGFRDERDL
jgi:DNA ligase 1